MLAAKCSGVYDCPTQFSRRRSTFSTAMLKAPSSSNAVPHEDITPATLELATGYPLSAGFSVEHMMRTWFRLPLLGCAAVTATGETGADSGPVRRCAMRPASRSRQGSCHPLQGRQRPDIKDHRRRGEPACGKVRSSRKGKSISRGRTATC